MDEGDVEAKVDFSRHLGKTLPVAKMLSNAAFLSKTRPRVLEWQCALRLILGRDRYFSRAQQVRQKCIHMRRANIFWMLLIGENYKAPSRIHIGLRRTNIVMQRTKRHTYLLKPFLVWSASAKF
jgi:hypothetical protein